MEEKKISRKLFLYYLFKRVRSNLKISFLLGLGILLIFGFMAGILMLAFDPLDRFGQWIVEGLFRVFGYPIDLPTGLGFLIIAVVLGTLIGIILNTQRIKEGLDRFLLKLPIIKWVWKFIRNFQKGLEELKNYVPCLIETYPGMKEIVFIKRVYLDEIETVDGEIKVVGWKAEGFLPTSNNPTSGRVFPEIDLKKIQVKITNPFEEIASYFVTCGISTPQPKWKKKQIDWKQDFGINPEDTFSQSAD